MPLQGLPVNVTLPACSLVSLGGEEPRLVGVVAGVGGCAAHGCLASLVEQICSSEPSRRLKSDRMTWRKGAPGGRMRSAAEGEHRTGEDGGEAFTLAPGQLGAMRRERRLRRADPPSCPWSSAPVLPAPATTCANPQGERSPAAQRRTSTQRCHAETMPRTRNRLHIYRRPCCATHGADPDTNRSAGAPFERRRGSDERAGGITELPCCRSDLFNASSLQVWQEGVGVVILCWYLRMPMSDRRSRSSGG
jgi:hypothetical protein